MGTQRLEQKDAYLTSCQARVVQIREESKQLALDESVFYPESGGQLGDLGHLVFQDGSVQVFDTQIEEGVVWHKLDQLPTWIENKKTCRAEIDWAHRRDQMSQHTAQHMLSAGVFQLFGGETVSARLGSQSSTIDLDLTQLNDPMLADLQASINQEVMNDRNIHIHYPSQQELAKFELRRESKVKDGIRLIDIEGYDVTPCGGTHCSETGEVGPVILTATQNTKGLVRLSFVAGKRAFEYLASRDKWLRESAQKLGCAVHEVCDAIERQEQKLSQLQQELGLHQAQALMKDVEETYHSPHRDVLLMRPDYDQDQARKFVNLLHERTAELVVVVCSKQPQRFVMHGGTSDLRQWLKQQGTAIGWRGGGKANHVEGVVQGSFSQSEIIKALRSLD